MPKQWVFSRVSLTHRRDGCRNVRGKTEETSVLVPFRESFVANCYVVHPLRYNTPLLRGTPVLHLNIWSLDPATHTRCHLHLPPPHHHDRTEPDELGWATLDDGKLYHTLTAIIAGRYPFDEP
ncbi:hypothetical protein BCR42DRAFT_496932 [Absidia repens]|uniref:Uncharacterized protein n=1 Tax=Absidia repens TaxID=90262 RepID=A0A1X2HXU9_9FUNG|nr:hypothetical protein BCR42DRAFT_496932 [Absidia repens]